MPTGLQLNRARGRRHAVRRIRGDVAQAMVEALERRLLLSSAGVSVNNAFLNHWTGYVNSSISVNVSGQWWQGTVGGGTAKTLVLGVHDLFGNWVNGTVPVVVQTGTPPANSPGSFWNWPLTLNVPAQGTYVIVAAEEPTSLSATAINDFKLGLEIAWAVAGTLTSSVAVPGMTVSNVSQTTWSSSVAGTISGSFTASVWNGSAGKNNVEAVVVGIRDMTGHWAAGSQPQVIDTMVPAVGSPGSSYAESFTGLSVPAKAGQYQVVVAEEPDPNSMLAFEAAADLATVTIGTLTVTASSTIWGPLLPFQTWDQAGLIAYGSSVNYNDYCPMDPATGERSVTGCVATTVSELAYYWRSLSSLTFGAADAFTSSAGTTSAVRIDADSGTDQFPNMSTLTTGLSHIAYDYTPSQMALLAFGMGVKVQADYTSSSTSAYVTTTLLRSMGYSNAAINSNWGTGKNLAVANLKAGQPVIVDFPDHMALIDGYNQATDQFHMVLGWGGFDDGWYTLNTATPFPDTTTTKQIMEIFYNLKPATPRAASLFVTSQPATTSANTGFSIVAQLKDITGTLAVGDHSTVTLSVLTGPAGGALNGVVTATAANGVVTFSGLSFSKIGNYTLALADSADSLAGFATGNIAVVSSLALSSGTLAAGTYGALYNRLFSATGNVGVVTLAVSNLQNPIAGLTLPNSSTTSLSLAGTPLATGIETFTVTATDTDGSTVTADYVLTINPAPLTVTTGAQSKTYGQTNPALTGTVIGVVAGDGITVNWDTAATQFSDPGGYPITATLDDPNNKLGFYIVSNSGNTLTITKANQQIAWTTPGAITYGTLLSDTQLNAAVSGVPGGAAPGVLQYGAASAARLPAGGVTLTVTAPATVDYNQATASVLLTVNQAPLTVAGITAADKVYDGTPAATLGLGAAALVGLIDADAGSVTLVTSTAVGTFASSNVGDNLTVNVIGLTLGGAAAANYALSQPATSAGISPRTLTVTGIAASNKIYDGSNAATLTLGAAALVGVLSADQGHVNLVTGGATGAFAGVNAGTGLAVAVSGLTLAGSSAGNYTLTQPATLANITPRPITVTASPEAKIYGASDPILAWQITTGTLVPGEQLTGALTRAAGEHVGKYPIAQGSLAAGSNYSMSFVASNLTIIPAPLTISADNQTRTFGAALPVLTASYSGLVNGDTPASLATAPKLATAAKASSSAAGNPYAITVAGAVDKDYAITYVPGALTVTAAQLAVTQAPASNVVGTALSPVIKIALEDGSANVLPAGGGPVTVTIISGPTHGQLKGTTTVSLASGIASFNTLSFTAAGDYTLQFAGNPAGNMLPVTLGLTAAQGVTTLAAPTVAAAGYTYGKLVTLSTTLKSTAASAVPFTGVAALVAEGGTVLATASVTPAGAATFSFTSVPAIYTCTIQYPGDANHTAAVSPAFTYRSNPAATTTALKASVASLFYGLPVTLTATVSSALAPSTPRTGLVTFYDAGVAVGTAPLDGASTATFPVTAPGVGTHYYTAAYSSDLLFKASTSAAKSVTVKKATVKVTLLPVAGPVVPGQPVTLAANVLVTAGINTPTGTVTFKEGSKTLGSATLDDTGAAALPFAFTTAGTHALTVTYAGDPQTAAASSPAVKVVVAKAGTQIAFTAPDASLTRGTATTFTIQLTPAAPATQTPTGKVLLKDGTKTLATLTLANGQAQWTTPTTLTIGLHALTAAYQGDANDLGIMSDVFDLTVV